MSTIRTRTGRVLTVVAVAASAGLGLAACGDEPQDRGTTLEDLNEEGAEDLGDLDDLQDDASEQDIAEAPNEDDSVAFFDDPGSFTDEPVTVRGEIVEVLSPQTFVIGEGDMATLVTRPTSDGVTLLPGYTAQVTGDVGTFVLPEVEEDLGVDLLDEGFAVFEDGPYIAAVDVNLLDQD
ncbi:hypothetical protein [Geodermatophilus sp. SYSU D00710]